MSFQIVSLCVLLFARSSEQTDCGDFAHNMAPLTTLVGKIDTIVFLQWQEQEILQAVRSSNNIGAVSLDSISAEGQVNILKRSDWRNGLVWLKSAMDIVLLSSAAENGLLEKYTWLVPEKLNTSGLNLRLDSRLYKYSCMAMGVVKIKEVYAVKKFHRMEKDVAIWNSSSEMLTFLSNPFIWERRSNLSGVNLTNTVNSWGEFSIIWLDNVTGKLSVRQVSFISHD